MLIRLLNRHRWTDTRITSTLFQAIAKPKLKTLKSIEESDNDAVALLFL